MKCSGISSNGLTDSVLDLSIGPFRLQRLYHFMVFLGGTAAYRSLERALRNLERTLRKLARKDFFYNEEINGLTWASKPGAEHIR